MFSIAGRQIAIENYVSNKFWSTFVDSINVFDCRLYGVFVCLCEQRMLCWRCSAGSTEFSLVDYVIEILFTWFWSNIHPINRAYHTLLELQQEKSNLRVYIPNPLHSNSAVIARVGCSRRVHRIVYLVVKKGNILVIILLLKLFITNYCH